jgi:hypothetical protein
LTGNERPGEAIGVGGFVAVLGIAFLINSFFERRSESSRPSHSAEPAPPQNPPARS